MLSFFKVFFMKLYSIFFLFVLCILSLCVQGQEEKALLMEIDSSRSSELFSKDSFECDGISFTIEPVVSYEDRGSQWVLGTPKTNVEISAWDLAHKVVSENEYVLYAEPEYTDVTLYYPEEEEQETKGSFSNDWSYPKPTVFAWHQGINFSQLLAARQPEVTGQKVRIIHFDTGYDPAHTTTPKNLRTDLQRNFISGENENSAVDIGSTGLLNQPGHGTATIAILAGNIVSRPQYNFQGYLGGAPFAEIVPVRLSKSVILFKSSAFVKALKYATDIKCDVLSMSMGGVASKAWADAVNDAYDKGLVMVTAAGNNIGKKPTVRVVYPARFHRVICACGITYDNTPYYKYGLLSTKMQGNWGPPSVMTSAIASYTPNISWAQLNGGDAISLAGGGTSSATPQIAAAAALWLQKYHSQTYSHPWKKVNAVRHALFSTAKKSYADSKKYYGNGVLQAKNALSVAPLTNTAPLPKDKVSWPIFTLLFGLDSNSEQAAMFEVELARLEYEDETLQKLADIFEEKGTLTKAQKEEFKTAILNNPNASDELKKFINK